MQDLGIMPFLDACVLSEEEGVAKPDPEIWRRAIDIVNAGLTKPDVADTENASSNQILAGVGQHVIHVGDELVWCVRCVGLVSQSNVAPSHCSPLFK